MSSRSRIQFPRAGRLMPLGRERSDTGNSARRRQACRGRRLPERLNKSIINLWRWRKQGVQPNMHHLLAHQNLRR